MPAAEHVQRQIAIAVVIAVEEAAFLVAMQRIIRGVEVEDDLIGRRLVRFEEQLDEQVLDSLPDRARSCGNGSDPKAHARAG